MKASVIVLNWNGKHLLGECLDTLLAQSYKDFEIILVDNGSTDDSVTFIQNNYADKVTLIVLKENQGFAGGNNVGIARAKGEYIILLNNDTSVDPHWMEELIRVATQDENIGSCASKIVNYYAHDEFDTLGHLMYADGLNRGRGKFEKDTGQYNLLEEVFFASGCAALFKKKMLDEIGLFDEDFFAYGDDTDIGLRSRLAGWKCMYVPTALVYHKSSASSAPYSPWKIYLVERNRILILFKYFPWRYVLLSPFYTAVRFSYNFLSIFMKRGATHRFIQKSPFWALVFAVIKAYSVSIIMIPGVLLKRYKLRNIKKISTGDFIKLLKKYKLSAQELTLKD